MKSLLFIALITLLFTFSCVMEGPDPYSEPDIPDGIMIFVEGGTFEMGDHLDEGWSEELPLHEVTVSSFWISEYEVTHGEYLEVMDYDPSWGYAAGRDDRPVYEVTWSNAIKYCNLISELEGFTPCYDLTNGNCNFGADGYRLPTEAEWEYAARGGIYWEENYRYSGTTDNLDEFVWYDANVSGDRPQLVGTRESNQLGIHDMSGNVWEWCNDWHSASYYVASPVDNPKGPASGSLHVVRGGSSNCYAHSCRISNRYYFDNHHEMGRQTGLRVVRGIM
ncbi:MAG: formylglycine-generating enzyme family protein [Candidatus Cloacimonetes bacterium]|nr:formylglycine-generating enzyme family protein [Candidatus Cloacimonadota bacterium]